MIVPAEYDGARAFDEGVGMLLSEGLWAYVDQEGRLLTRFEYEEAGPFREGVALVRRRGRIEAVDQRGRTAFTTDAGEALPFSGGLSPSGSGQPIARQRKVTISPVVQDRSGENSPPPVPVMTSWSVAQVTAAAYHAPGRTAPGACATRTGICWSPMNTRRPSTGTATCG